MPGAKAERDDRYAAVQLAGATISLNLFAGILGLIAERLLAARLTN